MTTGFYYVNIDICCQYGISVAESQTFPLAKHPSGEEQGETAVFAGYRKGNPFIYLLLANGTPFIFLV